MNINWPQVLIDASIAAMQGIQESGKIGLAADIIPEKLAKLSVKIGKCLVEELQKEIMSKDITEYEVSLV